MYLWVYNMTDVVVICSPWHSVRMLKYGIQEVFAISGDPSPLVTRSSLQQRYLSYQNTCQNSSRLRVQRSPCLLWNSREIMWRWRKWSSEDKSSERWWIMCQREKGGWVGVTTGVAPTPLYISLPRPLFSLASTYVNQITRNIVCSAHNWMECTASMYLRGKYTRLWQHSV